MEYIGEFISGIDIFVAVVLLLRDVNIWCRKINERISFMQEQNNLLEFRLPGTPLWKDLEWMLSNRNQLMDPFRKSLHMLHQKLFLKTEQMKGYYENIYPGFADGIKGGIYSGQAKD